MYATLSAVRTIRSRRGVILLVVLALLTAFAVVGLAFVLYADSEAKSSQIARESEQTGSGQATQGFSSTSPPYDLDPRMLLSAFLGQLIFDVDDDVSANFTANSPTAGTSALRGLQPGPLHVRLQIHDRQPG